MPNVEYWVIVNYGARTASIEASATKPSLSSHEVTKGPFSTREAAEREIERLRRVENW